MPLSLGGAYPGLYLFTNPSRFLRPVKNLSCSSDGSKNIELIAPFEQVWMFFLLCVRILRTNNVPVVPLLLTYAGPCQLY